MSKNDKEKNEIEFAHAEQKKYAKMLVRRDRELQLANDQLQKLDKEKSEFVSIAAHQLRTPLSAIRWALQMTIDGDAGDLTDEQVVLLSQAQESVKRMVELVNDLLDADNLEFDQIQYECTDINVSLLMKEVVTELAPMAKERTITLMLDSSEVPQTVNADVHRLKEAFLNILNNAIKYTPVHGSVTVRIAEDGPNTVVSVKDTGIGIPKDSQARLFHKFVRMKNAKKVDANGTGLGLFIVKRIIEAHNGTVTFESQVGEGTTFFITLPKSK